MVLAVLVIECVGVATVVLTLTATLTPTPLHSTCLATLADLPAWRAPGSWPIEHAPHLLPTRRSTVHSRIHLHSQSTCLLCGACVREATRTLTRIECQNDNLTPPRHLSTTD